MPSLEDRTLLLLVAAVSLIFAWILWPFFSAILWATVLAIVFAPLYRRILRSIGQHPNLAAFTTLLIIVTLVILPLSLTATSLVQEATSLYDRLQSGELNLGTVFLQLRDALPAWVTNLLDRSGLTNLGAVQERLSDALKKGSQFIAAQALSIGQGAADFRLGLARHAVPAVLFAAGRKRAYQSASRMRSRYRRTRARPFQANSPPSSARRSRAAFSWPRCKARWAV